MKRSTATAAITKGIARPKEYAPSSTRPCCSSACVAVYVRIPPRIGPMHGLQPAPNATPTPNAPPAIPAADADASAPAHGAPGREDATGAASMRGLLRWYYGLKYRVFRRERRPRDGRRGLIVLQIDALAYAELRRAIE